MFNWIYFITLEYIFDRYVFLFKSVGKWSDLSCYGLCDHGHGSIMHLVL